MQQILPATAFLTSRCALPASPRVLLPPCAQGATSSPPGPTSHTIPPAAPPSEPTEHAQPGAVKLHADQYNVRVTEM